MDNRTRIYACMHDHNSPPDKSPIFTDVFLQAQATDAYCRSLSHTVGMPNSDFIYDRCGFLIRRSKRYGAFQKEVPKLLRPRVLYLSHYPRLHGHSGLSRMYDTMRFVFYVLALHSQCVLSNGTRFPIMRADTRISAKAQQLPQTIPRISPVGVYRHGPTQPVPSVLG